MRKNHSQQTSEKAVLIDFLKARIKNLPDGFYDTFDWVDKPKGFCHGTTLGLIGEAFKKMKQVKYVGYDVRLYSNGHRINPDVVGFDSNCNVVIISDFESPNSSDARVVTKDIKAYDGWQRSMLASDNKRNKTIIPYFIITSLPNFESSTWKLKWVGKYDGKEQYNRKHRGMREHIIKNPLAYWKKAWRAEWKGGLPFAATILNISGKEVIEISWPRKP